MNNPITVQVHIDAPITKVWEYWTTPEHIQRWCFASDDWCAPEATNDIRTGGRFVTRMESLEGKIGFDWSGTYTNVQEYKLIEYTMDGDDHRKVRIEFVQQPQGVSVMETFEPEDQNPAEMQRAGWQSILDNFKKYISESI